MARQLSAQVLRLYPSDPGLASAKCQAIPRREARSDPDDRGEKWHPALRAAFAIGSTAMLWTFIAGGVVWLIG